VGAIPGFILILLGFGFLIFIHELGHFLAARWAGIRADGFAIGMGPCLLSYRRGVGLTVGSADAKVMRAHGKRPIEMSDAEMSQHGLGETEYSLRALPLGGYVRMLGQEDGYPSAVSADARSFGKAPVFRRGVVILAGIAANIALAIVLFLVAFLVGVRFPAATIGGIAPGSPAAEAKSLDAGTPDGLRPGDKVVAIDGDATETFLDIRLAAAMAKPDTVLDMTIEREGASKRFSVLPRRNADIGLLAIGVDPARSSTITDVRSSRAEVEDLIAADSPELTAAGVGPGWTAISVDGAPVGSLSDLERAAALSEGRPLTVRWRSPMTKDAPAREVETILPPRPDFQLMVVPARTPAAAPANGSSAATNAETPTFGLVGFAPLVRIGSLSESSVNRKTLMPGDIILRIGSQLGPRADEIRGKLQSSRGSSVPALIERDGEEIALEIRTNADGIAGIMMAPAVDIPRLATTVTEVVAPAADGGDPGTRATPAAALKALPLGTVESVNGTPVADFRALRAELVRLARNHAGDDPLSVRIAMRDPSPDASPVEMPIEIGATDLATLRSLGFTFPVNIGIFDPNFTLLTANGNPAKAVAMGFRQTLKMIEQVFLTLDRVGRGSVGVDQLQGPVGILHTGTKVADEGFMYMVFFLALISVNLAVVNALPIPIADGGLFMFLMYEKIRGRPPSIAFQNAAAMAGIALVAGIFLLTFYNDIVRLFA